MEAIDAARPGDRAEPPAAGGSPAAGRANTTLSRSDPAPLRRLATQRAKAASASALRAPSCLTRGSLQRLQDQGLVMLTKKLEHGQFVWPSTTTTGRIALTPAQLTALLDGCE
ncbi:MAG: IS66 family insertion sequence element accessory protein TnpB, partial [Rhodopila sp.]